MLFSTFFSAFLECIRVFSVPYRPAFLPLICCVWVVEMKHRERWVVDWIGQWWILIGRYDSGWLNSINMAENKRYFCGFSPLESRRNFFFLSFFFLQRKKKVRRMQNFRGHSAFETCISPYFSLRILLSSTQSFLFCEVFPLRLSSFFPFSPLESPIEFFLSHCTFLIRLRNFQLLPLESPIEIDPIKTTP